MFRLFIFSLIFAFAGSGFAVADSKKTVPAKAKSKERQYKIAKNPEQTTISMGEGTPVFELPPSAPSKEQPYALNVVYFVPADMEPFPEYERRISEIMLSVQKFYGEQMTRFGYTGRTFGMSKSEDGKTVNIFLVKSKKSKSEINYNSGGAVYAEVQEYFNSPECPVNECPAKRCKHRKMSDHTLIISTSVSGNDKDPGGVPFYGLGKVCFALDYPLFDMKYFGEKSELGRLFTKWYGGLAHELGHGLNLYHNSGPVGLNERCGTALMGYGNYSLGQNPTYLTPASCATLDCSQVFLTKKLPKKPSPQINELDELAIRFGPGGCRVSGKLPAKNDVKHVLVYYDKDGYAGVADDYDAQSFVAKYDAKKKLFSCAIPEYQIDPGKTKAIELRIHLINADTTRTILRFPFPNGGKDLINPEKSKLAEVEPPAPLTEAEKRKRERAKEKLKKRRERKK